MNTLNAAFSMFALAGLTLFGPSAHAGKECLPQPNMVCEVIGNIHLYTENKDSLKILRPSIESAQRSFETYFGAPTPLGAIIEKSLGKESLGVMVDTGLKEALQSQGIKWTLTWFDEEKMKEMKADLIRKELRKQLPNYSEDKLEALVKQALSTQSVAAASDKASALMESGLQHEIGHLLYMHSFWPNVETERKNMKEKLYGAPNSPDWLDEVAAILLEGDQLTETRRTQFKKLVNESGVQNLKPLSKYLSMNHPASSSYLEKSKAFQEGRKQAQSTKTTRVIILKGKDLGGTPEELIEMSGFYLISRAFADFMLETSGDQRIFSQIASAIKSGKNMESWLASQTTPLPKKMNELERAWLDWVNKNHIATAN